MVVVAAVAESRPEIEIDYTGALAVVAAVVVVVAAAAVVYMLDRIIEPGPEHVPASEPHKPELALELPAAVEA